MVTTPEEVILLALARMDGALKIVPTSFLMPTDLIRMTCAVGTDDGRIFLGGDDGCVHEMIYEDQTMGFDAMGLYENDNVTKQLEEFYDGTKVLPYVVDQNVGSKVSALQHFGKRTWQSISASENAPRKCRKLNRTSQASSLVNALVPTAMRKVSNMVFGGPTAQGGGRITKLSVDSERKVMYSLSEKGWVGVFDISIPKAAPCLAVCDVPKTSHKYLEAVQRGQMFPPNLGGSSTLGNVHFPGGGSAAQSGVGGMEGARNILKQADWQRNTSRQQAQQPRNKKPHPMLTPVALHIIPRADSDRVTLMAVTGGGLRLYMSCLSSNVLSSGRPVGTATGSRSRSLGSKMTLCHIRSPPPLHSNRQNHGLGGSSRWTTDTAGGMVPGVSDSRAGKVDASFYHSGQFVVAMEEPNEAVGGDLIVATTPDTAMRPREGADGEIKMEKTCGLSESVSFPIGGSRENGRPEDSSRVLSGGLVWEIDSFCGDDSGVMKLLMKSATPTDSELEVGLPPVYYPPAQIRQAKLHPNPSAVESRAIVTRGSSTVRNVALQVMRNVLMSFSTSRPLDYGLQRPERPTTLHQPTYRISKRYAVEGFSLTAAETKRTIGSRTVPNNGRQAPGSKHVKSARLRQWLLQPQSKSLNHWTKQHLIKPKNAVTALNVQGIHKFEFDTVLSLLADELMSSGDNRGGNSRITSFFDAYGYKEGCAMCLSLAIGCGPAEGDAGYSQQLRKMAKNAARARGCRPSLYREDQQIKFTSRQVVSNAEDPCVPQGYVFRPSALNEGLCSLVSRLLRPTWHKPLVVVTEGRAIKARWEARPKLTAAKVEILLDEQTAEEICAPLQSLASLMTDLFPPALNTVPGNHGQPYFAMDIDGGFGQQQSVTQALQYHSQYRNSGENPSHLTEKECESLAHLMEERNIHSMYRLVSRVVQLLRLLTVLRKQGGISGLPQVDWGLLHGVTVAQLAMTSEGHDRLETLLNELVVATAASTASSPIASQADHLASELAAQCYLYFPPSSRFTYQGLRLAQEALLHPPGSSHRKETGAQAASHLINAASHWQSASLITGRLVRANGKENYSEIAKRAIEYSSPLARAADLLVRLDDVSSVVDLCVETSSNFKVMKMPAVSRDSVRPGGMFAWEMDLYHKHAPAGGENQSNSGNSGTQSRTPVSNASYSSSVTAEDAIDTCYALVFFHLDGLLRTNKRLSDRMVSACAAVSDKGFLSSLFAFLVESSNIETLLRIDCAEAEAFLKDRGDANLLYRYYNVQEKHAEAARIAAEKAHETQNVALADRIEWLTRARNSYRVAQGAHRKNAGQMSEAEITKVAAEADDFLKVAVLQQRILREIDSLPEVPEDKIVLSKYEALKTTLIDINGLLNDYAAVVPLYGICLTIFHSCRHDDPDQIREMWRFIFCEEITPCYTRAESIYHALVDLAAECGLEDRVILLTDSQSADDDSDSLFESGAWIVPLQEKIIKLARELYGTGADYTFPIDYILERLQYLRGLMHHSYLSPGWSLITLSEAGIPYLVILEEYEDHVERSGNNETRLHVSAVLELFSHWISHSREAGQVAGQHSSAHVELSRAMATGDLRNKLHTLRAKVRQLEDDSELLQRLNDIEEKATFMVSI